MNDNATLPHADPEGYRAWKGWEEQSFGQFTHSESAYFGAELRELAGRGGGSPRVLEFGFGNGAFAGWCRQQKWDWVGTEIDPVLVDRARGAGYRAEHAREALERLKTGPSFDLIIAWDVVEHIAQVETIPFMTDARALLSTAGALVFRVPSGDSPFSRAIQHTDPTHAQILTSHGVRLLAQESGFRRCTTRATRLPILVPSLTGVVRRIGVRLVDAALHRAVKIAMRDPHAVITPNMMVIAEK